MAFLSNYQSCHNNDGTRNQNFIHKIYSTAVARQQDRKDDKSETFYSSVLKSSSWY